MVRLWNKLGSYEKSVLAAFLAFTMFVVGYYIVDVTGLNCLICQSNFLPNETYIWDTRSGDIFPISNYLDKESDIMWFDGKYATPQVAVPTLRCGYARFPYKIASHPHYCPSHHSVFEKSEYFLILHADIGTSVCYAISDPETLTPEGYTIQIQQNDELECWELVIKW